MAEGLSGRMLIEHKDAQGYDVFISRAWSKLFEIRGPLVHELILEIFSTFRFGEPVATDGALEAIEDALVINKGAPAVPAPAQAPQLLARNMAQRLARVEEEVHEIRGALGEQHKVMDA
ncbi:hypothetical protein Tco_1497376, partial [Tanacetum coccineum]